LRRVVLLIIRRLFLSSKIQSRFRGLSGLESRILLQSEMLAGVGASPSTLVSSLLAGGA
jgi:hypothetical protein